MHAQAAVPMRESLGFPIAPACRASALATQRARAGRRSRRVSNRSDLVSVQQDMYRQFAKPLRFFARKKYRDSAESSRRMQRCIRIRGNSNVGFDFDGGNTRSQIAAHARCRAIHRSKPARSSSTVSAAESSTRGVKASPHQGEPCEQSFPVPASAAATRPVRFHRACQSPPPSQHSRSFLQTQRPAAWSSRFPAPVLALSHSVRSRASAAACLPAPQLRASAMTVQHERSLPPENREL